MRTARRQSILNPLVQMSILSAAVIVGNVARTAMGPIQETLRTDLALTDNQIALLQGPTMAVPVVLVAIPLGLLLDRQSRARWVIVFAVGLLVGHIMTAMAGSFAVLLLARCLIGLTATATLTAAFSMLADLYPPDRRGRVSMLMSVSQMVGNSSAFAAGGWLLAFFVSAGDAWRWVLWTMSLPMTLVLCSLALLREPPRCGAPGGVTALAQAGAVLRWCLAATPLLVGMVTLEMIFGSLYVWGAPALSRTFHWAPARVGTIMAVGLMVSGFIGPIVGGIAADYCQRTRGPARSLAVVAAVMLISAPTGLFAFIYNPEAAAALLIAFMAMVAAMIVMVTAVFTILIPSELRAMCVAVLFALATLFGLGVAPVAVSVLSEFLASQMGRALSSFGTTMAILGSGAFGWAALRLHLESAPKETASA